MSIALDLAATALSREDFPVGCVLVSGDRLVGSGSRSHTKSEDVNEIDHAEISALRDWISRRPHQGDMDGPVTAYCNLEPCLMCLGAMVLNGIKRIVYAYEDVMGGAAGLDISRSLTRTNSAVFDIRKGNIYVESRIEILGGIKRKESIALFKRFFLDPSRSYWKDSLLYRYTLDLSD